MTPNIPTLFAAASAALCTCVIALLSNEALIFLILNGILHAGIVVVFMKLYFSDEERAVAKKLSDAPILVSVIAPPVLFAITSLTP